MRTFFLSFLVVMGGCDLVGAPEDPDADGDGSPASEDCDDADAKAHPGAPEVCDTVGRDEDCNGIANGDDPGVTGLTSYFVDADDDGFGDIDQVVQACDIDFGLASEAGDCDDNNVDVHPDATELCDGADRDEDCNGLVDDDDPGVDVTGYSGWYPDADGDGYGIASREMSACDAPNGWVTNTLDCDDTDADVSPDATERCNGFDDDCDGYADGTDSVDAQVWYADGDGDGFGNDDATRAACDRPSGFVGEGGDCDDSRPLVNPDATESCNELDDDCDGSTDESGSNGDTFYADGDGDGYGDADTTRTGCTAPAGYVSDDEDCDDGDSSIHPGATEACDASDTDEDCDGYADDADDSTAASGKTLLYLDSDGDTYGDATVSWLKCDTGSGWATNDDDCDDDASTAHPGGTEVCDSRDVDEDCDGTTDDDDTSTSAGSKTTYYLDADGDGYGLTASSVAKCTQPSGYATSSGDCDDADATRDPGNTEVCDAANVDEDCDSLSDDSDPSVSTSTKVAYYPDADGDGYGDSAGTGTTRCDAPAGYVAGKTDCDDADGTVNPGEIDVCFDSEDTDCDGSTGCSITSADASRKISGSASSDYLAYFNGIDGAGDVNNDGYDDLIVAGYGNDVGGSAAGRAYLILGGVSGDLSVDAAAGILTGEDASDQAGMSVAGIGDFDGDGKDDVAVGAPGDDDLASSAGAVYIVKGPVTTTDLSSANYKIRCGTSSYACGTVVVGLGDVNATGRGSVLFSAPSYSSSKGVVYLVTTAAAGSSAATSASAILTGESSSDEAGYSLADAGDVNGDGHADFLVGARYDDDTGTDAGAAYLFLGPVTGTAAISTADAKILGYSSSDYLGSKVGGGGDVSGDGYADMAVYASGYSSGTTYVVNGPLTGTANVSTTVDATLSSLGVATLDLGGDVDDDGTGDLLVGYSSGGYTFGFFGPLSGSLTAATADLTATGSGYFGQSARFIGDHDGDGADDFALGAYGDDGAASDAGAAFVFLNAAL